MFDRATVGLKIFLEGVSADGGSSEGVGYWSYGFGWFAELNRQLETRTHGLLSLVEGDADVRSTAAFGTRMTLSNGHCVNFSDNGPLSAPRPALLAYLAERFHDSFIRDHAALAWQRSSGPLDLNAQRADLMFLTRQFLRCPRHLGPAAQLPISDTLLADLGVVVTRFRDAQDHLWEFAAKAGHNDEHHNHNDLGGYLLNIDGRRMLTEIGSPEYVRDFFGPRRYTFLAAHSLGHPVPLIHHHEQPAGKNFRSQVLRHEASATQVLTQIDLTGAYPAEAECTKCLRQFRLDKLAGQLIITDTFNLTKAGPIETALITASSAVCRDGSVIVTHDGVSLRTVPGPESEIAQIQEHRYSDHDGHSAAINRIVLIPKTQASEVTISCCIDLLP
jgi:hypothetical protein